EDSGGQEMNAVESCQRRSVTLKRLQSMIGGDLERILMKAIDRDPDRRYQTVEQFTDDVKRFLAGEPVRAQADSLSYRAKKFLRRNAIAVAAAVTFIAMLLAGVAITTRLAIVARRFAENETRLRVVAEQREQTANEVLRLFDQFMSSSDPRKTGNPDYPARRLLNEFAQQLQAKTAQDPVVEARLLQSLASALTGLGDYPAARLKAEKAVSLLSKQLGPEHLSTLAAKLLVARAALLNQAPGIATAWLRQVIESDDPTRNDDPDWNLIQFNALTRLAEAERLLENLDDAEWALAVAESKVPLIEVSAKAEAKDDLRRTRLQLLIAQRKLEQALPSAREDYENAKQLYGESDYRTAEAGDLLASIYLQQHRFDLAIELYESSFRISRQLFGEDRQNTLLRVLRLAETNYLAENYAAADSYFRIYEPLHSALKRYGGDHHHEMLRTWSECLCKVGKFDEAEALLHHCYLYHAKGGENAEGDACTSIQSRLVELFRDTGRDKLAENWSVPPETPLHAETAAKRVGPTGEVTLIASSFVHAARDMTHHATRWQVRAADQTFEYSPTLDVTTTRHLEQLTIPAGILLPNEEYSWRVAYLGRNRLQSVFSLEQELQTGELDYELEPIDLTRYFNRDVVHSPGDESEDPFKPVTKQLVIDGYRPDPLTDEAFRGVPQDGTIGPHQLGDYQTHNSIQLDRRNDRVVIELSPTYVSSLRILLGAFLNGYRRHEDALKATLVYSDGTRKEHRVDCPDWNWKIDFMGQDSELLPANIVRNGLDRGYVNGGVERANNALFDTLIPVDMSRKLTSILFVADDEGPLNPGARINILAITGVVPK
ncbi:MAG: tetratricopeptide repeat protein, partial [Planctomycetota bacterium]